MLGNLRDAFLCPVKIFLDLLGCLHAVCEIGAGTFEPPLSKRLQLQQFLLLRVEGARSGIRTLAFDFFIPIPQGQISRSRNLRLCLPCETSIQRQRIDGITESVVHQLHEIDPGGPSI